MAQIDDSFNVDFDHHRVGGRLDEDEVCRLGQGVAQALFAHGEIHVVDAGPGKLVEVTKRSAVDVFGGDDTRARGR